MLSHASSSASASSRRRTAAAAAAGAALQPPQPTMERKSSDLVAPTSTTHPSTLRSTFKALTTTLSLLLLSIPLLFALSSAIIVPVGAQQPPQGTGVGQANNATTLRGTWSSGAGNVVTGLSFFNPANNTFNYPSTAGQAYSFTDDGHWEQALYLYTSMPAKPFCVTAQLIWQHGTYTINASNYLLLTPFVGDGMQQISSRCTQTSQMVEPYNQNETMKGFEIQLDTHFGTSEYYLKMYEFDGTPKPLMWKIYDPPQMLPTVQLKEPILNAVGA